MLLNIRRARSDEAGLVLAFIRELADYEKLSHELEASEAMIAEALFGDEQVSVVDGVESAAEDAETHIAIQQLNTYPQDAACGLEETADRIVACGAIS